MSYCLTVLMDKEKDAELVNKVVTNNNDLESKEIFYVGTSEWRDFGRMLSTLGECVDKEFQSEYKVKLSDLAALADIGEKIKKWSVYFNFMESNSLNGLNTTEKNFYKIFNGYDESVEYWRNDLEKYNGITNPEVAKSVRAADLEYADMNERALEKNKVRTEKFLEDACSEIKGHYTKEMLIDAIMSSVTVFVMFVENFSPAISVANKIFGGDYEVTLLT